MKTPLRTTWPQVRIHESGGHQYYLVDTRRAGLSIPRKTFGTQDEALLYASEIAEKFAKEGKQGLQRVDFVMSDQVKKWTDALTPYGKDVEWAVDFALEHLKQEAKITKTIAEYLQDWQDSKTNNTLQPMRPASIQSLKTRVSFFKSQFNGNLLSAIDKEYLKNWLNKMEVTNSSKMNYKRYLVNFFNYLIDQKLIVENPIKSIRIDTSKADTRYYSLDEIKEMVEKVPQELFGFFALCLFAGVRPTECSLLTWDNIDFEHGEVFIPKTIAKTKKERIIYATKNGLDNLMVWLKTHKDSGLPLIPANLSKAMKNFKKSLSFSWLQDALRHSFATWHFAKHQSYEVLRAVMGTSDIYIDQNYKRSISQQGVDTFWDICG